MAEKKVTLGDLAKVVRAQQAVIDALPPMEESAEVKRREAKAACEKHLGD